ncbi:hypothetical protein [Streptomyces gardneri]|uniref:hypothetical protein n=1 Tax=Streptomyces gardneri TaxID=66892 RepID=UPI0033C5FD05
MLTTDGTWRQLPTDPLAPFEELDDWDKAIEAAGYYKWGVLGRPDETPLWLDIYRRKTTPGLTVPFCLAVISNHGFYETVYAESLPAMMDLQTRWAPAIQAAAITDLLGKLDDRTTTHGFAGMIRKALA